MERKTALLVVFISFSVSLLVVPSISLYYYGCHAGTKGLFEWLPSPWSSSSADSHPCEAGEVIRNGYQALCPQPSKDALEELLDTIGFFGTRESQELALCKFGKSTWKSVMSFFTEVYGASVGLHRTVTKSLTENSISLERLLEMMLATVRGGLGKITDWVGTVKRMIIEPVVRIPYQIKQQYLEFLEMYKMIRNIQQKWSIRYSFSNKNSSAEGAIKDDGHTAADKGYIASAVGYFTQDTGSRKTLPSSSEPSATSSLLASDVKEDTANELSQGELEDTATPGYISKILNFVTDTEGDQSSNIADGFARDTDRSNGEEEIVATQTLRETFSSDALPEDDHISDGHRTPGIRERETIGSQTLKKVLFEALVATVMAFTMFIMGVFIYRLRRAQRFGFELPSLRQALVSKYRPIKGIGASEHFYKFHMVSKRTHENVFVKYLRGRAAALAMANFDEEQRCLKTLNHSSIIVIIESIRVGTRLCLVMEYAEYGNLKIAMRTQVKPLGFYEKLRIYRQIAEAVQWMHKLGWGHLNVRPTSILVFEMWYLVKLSGFTRAVELHYGEHCRSYRLHAMCSPPSVMARHAFNPAKADLWALGTLLFYLFTRRSIHTHAEAVRVAHVVSKTDFYQNAQRGLNLVKILSDLLSFDPNNRPEIRELIQAINIF